MKNLVFYKYAPNHNDKLEFDQSRFDGSVILFTIWLSLLANSVSEEKIKKAMLNVEKIFEEKKNDKLRTPSTYLMQDLGFDGIDVRGTEADNTQYGSVIFAKSTLEEDNYQKILSIKRSTYSPRAYRILRVV